MDTTSWTFNRTWVAFNLAANPNLISLRFNDDPTVYTNNTIYCISAIVKAVWVTDRNLPYEYRCYPQTTSEWDQKSVVWIQGPVRDGFGGKYVKLTPIPITPGVGNGQPGTTGVVDEINASTGHPNESSAGLSNEPDDSDVSEGTAVSKDSQAIDTERKLDE